MLLKNIADSTSLTALKDLIPRLRFWLKISIAEETLNFYHPILPLINALFAKALALLNESFTTENKALLAIIHKTIDTDIISKTQDERLKQAINVRLQKIINAHSLLLNSTSTPQAQVTMLQAYAPTLFAPKSAFTPVPKAPQHALHRFKSDFYSGPIVENLTKEINDKQTLSQLKEFISEYKHWPALISKYKDNSQHPLKRALTALFDKISTLSAAQPSYNNLSEEMAIHKYIEKCLQETKDPGVGISALQSLQTKTLQSDVKKYTKKLTSVEDLLGLREIVQSKIAGPPPPLIDVSVAASSEKRYTAR